jgi:uncharacterized membrane protein YjgN (DUF898 family)
MFQEALNYPRNDENWIRTVLIGAVLALLSVFLVPVFALFGYYMRVLRGSMEGDEQPPVFDEWGDLLVDGVKAFVVFLAYMLIPAIIFGVTVGGVIVSAILGNGEPGFGAALGALVGFGLSLVVTALFWYLLPAALANYARTGRIGSGFAFGEIRPALTSQKYAVPWLVAIGVLIAAGIVVSLLNIVPFVGFVLALPVNFYAAVVAFNLYGRGYEDATRLVVETPEEPGAAAV